VHWTWHLIVGHRGLLPIETLFYPLRRLIRLVFAGVKVIDVTSNTVRYVLLEETFQYNLLRQSDFQ